jgi:FtsP/CotA-like multicopper oxidase with cupredoxin domain
MRFPRRVIVSEGHFEMDFDVVPFTNPFDSTDSFYTRGYAGNNGGLGAPLGPIWVAKPGDTISYRLNNRMQYPNPNCKDHPIARIINIPGMAPLQLDEVNHVCFLNTTNMHTHGLHVSAKPGQDDVFTSVLPGTSFEYNVELPSDHMGGTHWYHPHIHHATAVQAGGGAAGMIIIQDREGALPPAYANMEEVPFFMQLADLLRVKTMASHGLDALFKPKGSQNFVVVNGQYQPTHTINEGQWYRFRMVYAAVERGARLEIDGSNGASCEMQLMAKDGVYLHEMPRKITSAAFFSGARADIAIRCSCPRGSTRCAAMIRSNGRHARAVRSTETATTTEAYTGDLVELLITPTGRSDPDLPRVRVKRPCYLADLRNAVVPSANKHDLNVQPGMLWDGQAQQGFNFQHDPRSPPLADIPIGQVHEWRVHEQTRHPMHLHVNHYQLQNMGGSEDGGDNFYEPGDWHDTFLERVGTITVRLQTDRFVGNMVVHCHILEHEDEGMMGYFDVVGQPGTRWPGARALDPTCYMDSANVGYTLL